MFAQVVNKLIPLRMSAHEELLGADLSEHLIRHQGVGVSRVLSALINQQHQQVTDLHNITVVGSNTGNITGTCRARVILTRMHHVWYFTYT
jgi:Amt family ammonium transporter